MDITSCLYVSGHQFHDIVTGPMSHSVTLLPPIGTNLVTFRMCVVGRVPECSFWGGVRGHTGRAASRTDRRVRERAVRGADHRVLAVLAGVLPRARMLLLLRGFTGAGCWACDLNRCLRVGDVLCALLEGCGVGGPRAR
jgi:hypothetical protein